MTVCATNTRPAAADGALQCGRGVGPGAARAWVLCLGGRTDQVAHLKVAILLRLAALEELHEDVLAVHHDSQALVATAHRGDELVVLWRHRV